MSTLPAIPLSWSLAKWWRNNIQYNAPTVGYSPIPLCTGGNLKIQHCILLFTSLCGRCLE